MGAHCFFALSACLLGQRALGRHFAVLAVRFIPLQGNGDTDGHEVGKPAAALGIRQFHTPVRVLIGFGQFDLGPREFFLFGEHRNLGMMAELGGECGLVQAHGIHRRLRAERQFTRVADPARERGLGSAHAPLDFADAILDLSQCAMRREDLGLTAAPGAIGAFGRGNVELYFVGLLGQHVRDCFGVVAIDPGECGITLDIRHRRGFFRQRLLAFTLEALRAQFTLLSTRPFLRKSDPAFGEIVIAESESIGAVHRPAVEAEFEDGIGQLAGGDRHLMRGDPRRVFRRQLTRARDCEALGLSQRERRFWRGDNGLQRKQRG